MARMKRYTFAIDLYMKGTVTVAARNPDEAYDRCLDVLEWTQGECIDIEEDDSTWEIDRIIGEDDGTEYGDD